MGDARPNIFGDLPSDFLIRLNDASPVAAQFATLCHELGHVVAMWGDRSNQEDHHAWAHYTGIVICQHVSERFAGEGFMKEIRDARWRTIDKAAEGYGATEPGPDSYESVLALFVKLHEEVGPKAIGDAINFLDEEDRRLRINGVRYYAFDDLARGFEKTLKSKKQKKLVEELIP